MAVTLRRPEAVQVSLPASPCELANLILHVYEPTRADGGGSTCPNPTWLIHFLIRCFALVQLVRTAVMCVQKPRDSEPEQLVAAAVPGTASRTATTRASGSRRAGF